RRHTRFDCDWSSDVCSSDPEEGLASMKDIDLGLMAGAGIMPPPFARADQQGLDEVLAKLERAAQDWGEAFEPPTILRRLVAQGQIGRASCRERGSRAGGARA